MQRTYRIGLLALTLVIHMTHAAELPGDLTRAVEAYDQAQVKGDRSELVRLLADDYTLLNSNGRLESKTQLISDFTAPGYKLKPFVVRDPIIKCWEGGAVFAGIATLQGVEAGKAFDQTLRFSDIWAKRNGSWQVIYTHVSKAHNRSMGSARRAPHMTTGVAAPSK